MDEQNNVDRVNTSDTSNSGNTPNPGDLRRATTRSILNTVASATGRELSSVEDLIELLKPAQAESKPSTDSADVNPDYSAQIAALKTAMERKDREIAERDMTSQIWSAMGDEFEPELKEFVVSKVRERLKFNAAGAVIVVDEMGNQKFNPDNGNPAGIADVVGQVARNYPRTLRMSEPKMGSGLRQGNSNPNTVPDYTADPAAFNLWAQRNGLGKGNGLRQMRSQVSSSIKR